MPQSVTTFGDGAFKKVTELKKRPLEGDLINLTSILIRRGNSGTQRDARDSGMCAHRGKTMPGHRVKVVICELRGETSDETQPTHLALLTSRTVRNKFLLFKLPSLWYFVIAALETNIASNKASL